MIEVKDLASFDRTVQGWFEAVERAVAEAAVGLAHAAFEEVLETSPQYSGDFVANWRVSKGTAENIFVPGAVPGHHIFQMGDSPAMTVARSNAKWPKIKLGETVVIYNAAAHDEPYAMKIEMGQIALRDVNHGASHMVRRAVAKLNFMYQSIGPVQLDILRKFGA